jgi:hypothetical protein
LNCFVFAKIEGYQPVDQVPQIELTSPLDGQIAFGSQDIQPTAIDDKGVSKVEFYLDGALKSTDHTSPCGSSGPRR